MEGEVSLEVGLMGAMVTPPLQVSGQKQEVVQSLLHQKISLAQLLVVTVGQRWAARLALLQRAWEAVAAG